MIDAGAVTQATLYEAFGDSVAQTGGSDNNRLANTKERDASLGLDDHGFRYNDPSAGRYLTRDPIGYGDGTNVYSSVGNDPVNGVDPLGLQALRGGEPGPRWLTPGGMTSSTLTGCCRTDL